MKKSFLTVALAICLFLFVICLIFPKIISWLVVIIFVSLITKQTLDGIKLRQQLLSKKVYKDTVESLKQTLLDHLNKINSNNLYKINKISLLEKVCRDNHQLQTWEKNKRYYQSLPNLMLAFGLLGTFVGITMNLFLLSRNTAGDIPLDKTLEDIIASMAIAFVSSLLALISSVVITKFYPTHDLEIQHENIFNDLEYYLENEYLISKHLPSIQEKIDDLIEAIVNLPQTVKDFETSVSTSSQQLTASANYFENVIQEIAQAFQTDAKVLNQASNNLGKTTKDFSNFTTTLNTSASALNNTRIELADYTVQLQTTINNLANSSSRIQSLIQSNQQDLSTVSVRLEENANTLTSATQAFNINSSQIKEALNNHTGQINIHNSNLQNLSVKIVEYSHIMENIQRDLNNIIKLLQKRQNF